MYFLGLWRGVVRFLFGCLTWVAFGFHLDGADVAVFEMRDWLGCWVFIVFGSAVGGDGLMVGVVRGRIGGVGVGIVWWVGVIGVVVGRVLKFGLMVCVYKR